MCVCIHKHKTYHFKHFLVHRSVIVSTLHCCAAITTVISRILFILQNWNLCPLSNNAPSLPRRLAPPSTFCLWIGLLQGPHRSGLIQYYYKRLISLSIMSLRFIHVVVCVRVSSFFKAKYLSHCFVLKPRFVLSTIQWHSLVSEHLFFLHVFPFAFPLPPWGWASVSGFSWGVGGFKTLDICHQITFQKRCSSLPVVLQWILCCPLTSFLPSWVSL